MKKRHEEWLKLTTGNKPVQVKIGQPLIRMIDLPDFQRMEDKLRINPPVRGLLDAGAEAFINQLSEKTFGTTQDDTLFKNLPGYDDLPGWSEEREAIDELYNTHEDRFETSEVTDDEAVAILMKLGFDFNDHRGQPLNCTKLFCRQAEAAAKGIMGMVPDREAANLESWAKAMEREVELRMKKKRSA
jgi:hypothetical protein